MAYEWTYEFQRNIIRLLLHDESFLLQFRGALDPKWFTDAEHRGLAQSILDVADASHGAASLGSILEVLPEVLEADMDLEEAQDEARRISDDGLPADAEFVRKRVIEFGATQRLEAVLLDAPEFLESGRIYELVDAVRDAAYVESAANVELYDHLDEFMARMKTNKARAQDCVGFGIESVDAHLEGGGLAGGEMCVLCGLPGFGKALPLTASVMTPEGWRRNGDLSVGDSVLNPEGGSARITSVFDFDCKPMYRVTFSDGASVECCDEHLWRTRPHNGPWRTIPLREIMDRGLDARWYIPVLSRLDTPRVSLPFDPYLLGLLLGDGSFSKGFAKFTTADPELVEAFRDLGYAVTHYKGYDYGIPGLGPVIRELGLANKRSEAKFVPRAYMNGSSIQRLAILRGLMDADGWVQAGTALCYSSASRVMAEQVVALVRSLGGTATLRLKETTHLPAFSVGIKLPVGVRPFSLGRKIAAYKRRDKYAVVTRRITSVVRVLDAPARCIMLDSENHLYVTDDYIVTHNTETLVNIGANAIRKGKRVFHALVGDSPNTRVSLRYDCNFTGRTVQEVRLNYKAAYAEMKALYEETGGQGRLKVQWWPANTITPADLEDYLRWLYVRHAWKPDVLIVDYGANMKAPRGHGDSGKRHEQADIYKDLNALGGKLDIPVYTAIQANRKDGTKVKTLTMDHFAEAFEPARDATLILTVNMTKDERDAGIMRYHCAKYRDADSFWTETLDVDFPTHTIKDPEFNAQERVESGLNPGETVDNETGEIKLVLPPKPKRNKESDQ